MRINGCGILLFLCIIAAAAGAAARDMMPSWGCRKEIILRGKEKYKAFFLDEEVYKRALPDLADLRIVDAHGDFVPYYLQNGYTGETQREIRYNAIWINTFRKNRDQYFDFRVIAKKEGADIIGNKVALEVSGGNFHKRVDLYGSHDGFVWEPLGSREIYRLDYLALQEIDLPAFCRYNFYRIKIPANTHGLIVKHLNLIYDSVAEDLFRYVYSTKLPYEIKNGVKQTVVILDNRNRLCLKQIYFEISGDFQRLFTIYAEAEHNSFDSRSEELYHIPFQGRHIEDASIDLAYNPISWRTVKIRIANGDDRPLPIRNIRVDYYVDKMVFESAGKGPYYLYFGNRDAEKPRYDMELYKAYLEKEKQDLCGLGPADVSNVLRDPKKRPSQPWQAVCNIAATAAAVLLALILITILRGPREKSK
ncbi:MAG: DUF3999 family protein [Bacillota bacterium]